MKIMRKLLTALLFSVFIFPAMAQSSSTASGTSAAANPPATAAQSPARATDQPIPKVSNQSAPTKETAAQDDTEQLKQSSAVKWLGQHLHISTLQAYWLAVILNFLVIGWAVYVIWAKKGLAIMEMPAIPVFARARTADIRKQMDDAQHASDDATRRLKEIEARLNQLGSEIASLQAEAASQQQNEEARFKVVAAEEKERLLRSTQQEIASASTAARRELRAYAAELAVNLAEKKIQIDATADQTLVSDFVNQLGRNGN